MFGLRKGKKNNDNNNDQLGLHRVNSEFVNQEEENELDDSSSI